jgi:hypothetical protein
MAAKKMPMKMPAKMPMKMSHPPGHTMKPMAMSKAPKKK